MFRRSLIAFRKSERIARIPADSLARPTLTGVSPSTLDAAGGEAVTLTGTGFSGYEAQVWFDTTPATSVVVVSDTSITCVSPAHAAGAIYVVMRSQRGDATSPATYGSGLTFRILLETGDVLLTEAGDALRKE
jgi:hypothetical protein